MEKITDNMQKYYNYREQMGRLKKALSNGFLLEAIFIEYSVMEDRTEAILRYDGNEIKKKDGRFVSIDSKLKKISKLAEEKKGLPHRYFDADFLDSVREWKERRNTLIHGLVRQQLTTEDLAELADEGHELVKELNKRSANYKKAVERKNTAK